MLKNARRVQRIYQCVSLRQTSESVSLRQSHISVCIVLRQQDVVEFISTLRCPTPGFHQAPPLQHRGVSPAPRHTCPTQRHPTSTSAPGPRHHRIRQLCRRLRSTLHSTAHAHPTQPGCLATEQPSIGIYLMNNAGGRQTHQSRTTRRVQRHVKSAMAGRHCPTRGGIPAHTEASAAAAHRVCVLLCPSVLSRRHVSMHSHRT